MDPTNAPAKQRGGSYADAVRGHRVLTPKRTPAGDKKTEAAPLPKEISKATQGAVQKTKTTQKKGPKATQKKGPKAGPKAAHGSDAELLLPKQSAKPSQPKSSKSTTARGAAERPSKSQFSYAEAVKGKSLSMTLRPKNVETSQQTKSESSPSTEVSTPRHPAAHQQQKLATAKVAAGSAAAPKSASDRGPSRTSRQNEADIIRHPAAHQQHPADTGRYRRPSSSAYVAADKSCHQSSTHRPYQRMPNNLRSEGDSGLVVYKQSTRRFSAGDLSSSSSSLVPSVYARQSSSAPPSTASATPAHRTFSTLSLNTSSTPLPNDYVIEAAIQQAIKNEKKRIKMAEERDDRARAVIASHDRSELSLWESQYEWDVMIKCGDRTFRVHRDILCRESNWFEERLPPKDPNGGYVTFDCTGHCNIQLSNALYYMYNHTYYNGSFQITSALNGEPLRRAVLAYISGSSVNCLSMMQAALDGLDQATFQLKRFFEQTPPATLKELDMSGLYIPLTAALFLTYEQGSDNDSMFGLRAALAHLLDVTMMYLSLSPGFVDTMTRYWSSWLLPQTMNDAVYFDEKGLLDNMYNAQVRRAEQQQQQWEEEEENSSPGSSSSSAKRRKRRPTTFEEESEREIPIWRDGEPGKEVTPTRWATVRLPIEGDDWVLDGVRMTPEQQREVRKENVRDILIQGYGGPVPPRGGTRRGPAVLGERENFHEHQPQLIREPHWMTYEEDQGAGRDNVDVGTARHRRFLGMG
ncbi:hypothetical protein C8A00DRAFT_29254 [Chaetomidium leptoderma]|uniref:BTB domain-containing protein n=1 Tax=Chaetomidium leptoderma TaxID=669021 RepID=A0AAN7A1F3_9PEZI|nr:hypothetical protein C8A00DRAFT_29254 [Chaetomidium leptoderma]